MSNFAGSFAKESPDPNGEKLVTFYTLATNEGRSTGYTVVSPEWAKSCQFEGTVHKLIGGIGVGPTIDQLAALNTASGSLRKGPAENVARPTRRAVSTEAMST